MIIQQITNTMIEKKQYSLSTEAYENLKKIAKWEKRTMSATVELLILEKFKTVENQRKELSTKDNQHEQ